MPAGYDLEILDDVGAAISGKHLIRDIERADSSVGTELEQLVAQRTDGDNVAIEQQ